MNTDKLMELPYEAGLRNAVLRVIDAMRRAVEREQEGKLTFYDPTNWADELAAALRAEQAVGEDCNCLSLMADGTGPAHLVDCPAGQPAERGAFYTCPICHSLGVVTQETFDKFMPARQSEGVVFGVTKVERDFRWDGDKQHHVPLLKVEFDPILPTDGYDAKGWKDRDSLAAMLAAAPGGEGEG